MNNFCYTIAVRQRTCENGVARNTDNVYTNVTPESEISLHFGYVLTFISGSSGFATIQLSNNEMIPNLIFNIPTGGYKIFDLPVQSGHLRVYIGITSINCSETIVCSTI